MYRIYKFRDVVRIPPERFGEDLKKVALDILREDYEGTVDKELGIILTVTDVKIEEEGYILPGDGATYHEVEFDLVAFVPLRHEVVEGIVDNVIPKAGVEVNIGPVLAFAHRSQLGDDRFIYDPATGSMVGERSKVRIKKGDKVRGKIVQVSYANEVRIGITMRQPHLGKIEEGGNEG